MATAFPRLRHGHGSGHHAAINDRNAAQRQVTADGPLTEVHGRLLIRCATGSSGEVKRDSLYCPMRQTVTESSPAY